MPRLQLTDSQVSTLRSLWGTGLRRDEIAQAAGLTVDSLASAKRMLGLPSLPRGNRRPRGTEYCPTPDAIGQACEQIRRGWTVEEHGIRQGYRPLGTEDEETARRLRIIPIAAIVSAWD